VTDRALANAEKRRDDLAARINKWNQELEDFRKELTSVQEFIDAWYRFAGSEQSEVADLWKHTGHPQGAVYAIQAPDPSLPAPTALPPRKNPERAVVGLKAKEIILDLRRPVPRNELFSELERRGIKIHGKDPEMVLSTMMWRMQDQFVRLQGLGYWLRDVPWPLANYEPKASAGLENQDPEDFELMRKNILDPAGMADVEPSDDDVEVTTFRGHYLRPQKLGEGWVVHIQPVNGNAPTRTTMMFSTVDAAIQEAQKAVGADDPPFTRRI
jgi:hypothetical protein